MRRSNLLCGLLQSNGHGHYKQTHTHTYTHSNMITYSHAYIYVGIKGVISIKIINSLQSIHHYNCGLAFISISLCISLHTNAYFYVNKFLILNHCIVCVCVFSVFFPIVVGVAYFFSPAFCFAFECPKKPIN